MLENLCASSGAPGDAGLNQGQEGALEKATNSSVLSGKSHGQRSLQSLGSHSQTRLSTLALRHSVNEDFQWVNESMVFSF